MSSTRPKVVFDCNVLLQAVAREQGPAAQCLRLVERGFISLYLRKRGRCQNHWPNSSSFDTLFAMTQAALTRSFKQALAASLRDHRDDFRDLLAEVIEDVALASAIREGEESKPVKRESVIRALRDTK